MTEVIYVDGRDTGIKGVYNKPLDVVFVDVYLDDIEKKKVTYHELGHVNHTKVDYKFNRERCELQANRNMIHHLLKEELALLDDLENFNYLNFMEKYNLKTIADEVMIKEEFKNIIRM
ncbi:ImmA/IrrE family metallo-endopeptidase [Streptococcus jiangjianxini]|uniref:ImmA/IrrE family metallo-endopeptidase n=1 Tax=Streptococcus jiangjianxini TaxID=3161189 RepID=UPI0032EC3ED8